VKARTSLMMPPKELGVGIVPGGAAAGQSAATAEDNGCGWMTVADLMTSAAARTASMSSTRAAMRLRYLADRVISS